ncbi:stage II sporulation protein D [Thermosediminibacter oceani]|uniref:Stage II sporulation protein D n=1 Tax=Thermosediminibacter oceani (strain ATCC BAA-1034 / DSM 16646 / JW/IW-1228P) TaxID=555079 RepID=D9RZV9_THEOJ|nr:stage II sporulation protein D [Thermosediminibacter oceani DSM 16646]
MRNAAYYLIFFIFFVVIILPAFVAKSCNVLLPERPGEREKVEKPGELMVSLYVTSQKKIEKIPLEEYVKGVVAAEMPAGFKMEALKAQAVAARTYAYKRLRSLGGSGCSLHPEADICDDPTHCQAWITKTEMLRKWGIFAFYHYYSKISQAVNSTAGMVILYQGNPIDPLFFSTSNGKTENSEDVWGKYVPYLRSVTSPGEEISPRFVSVKEIPVEEVVSKLQAKWPDIVIDPKHPERQWKVLEVSEGGRIKTMQVGNKVIKGTEFRMLFELNSTDIKWERSGNNIKFTCKGYGHGVGMSQYGANAMADKGSNYVDILKHYYSGVEIQKINAGSN